MDGEIKDPEEIVERWPGFGPQEDEDGDLKPNRLIGHSRVHFTDEGVIVDLRNAVTLLDGTKTKSLLLSEPCAHDLKSMDSVKGSVSKSAGLLAAVGNMMPSEVAKIKGSDFLLAQEVIGGFLSDGPGIPGTSKAI